MVARFFGDAFASTVEHWWVGRLQIYGSLMSTFFFCVFDSFALTLHAMFQTRPTMAAFSLMNMVTNGLGSIISS